MKLPKILGSGDQTYLSMDRDHRNGGPAKIWNNGTQVWARNGRYHRIGGPAWIWAEGGTEWWNDGERIMRNIRCRICDKYFDYHKEGSLEGRPISIGVGVHSECLGREIGSRAVERAFKGAQEEFDERLQKARQKPTHRPRLTTAS